MDATVRRTDTSGGDRWPRAAAVVLAVILQAIVLVPFTVASGLLAPLWAIAVFYVLWVIATGALVLVARRRPLLAPLVPIVNAALLWGGITFGDVVLGWTA